MNKKYKKLYKNILNEYEKLSTFARLKVAALLVKDGRVVSVGFNGVASGKKHCNDIFKHDEKQNIHSIDGKIVTSDEWYNEHHVFSENNEIHAEVNTLMFALRSGLIIDDHELIISISPCINCAKMIISSGIRRVYYKDIYDRNGSLGLDLLAENGIDVVKL